MESVKVVVRLASKVFQDSLVLQAHMVTKASLVSVVYLVPLVTLVLWGPKGTEESQEDLVVADYLERPVDPVIRGLLDLRAMPVCLDLPEM